MRRGGGWGVLLMAALGAGTAAAAEKACFIPYAAFEEKIPHMDIDVCPGHAARPGEEHCRIALHGSEVLIYLFRMTDGEPCLAAVDRYAFADFVARFGVNYTKP